MSAVFQTLSRAQPHDPSRRGYHAVYRPHQTNHCPGCGRTHWYVGRASAECGFCATALPFASGEFAVAEQFLPTA
jgi:hypothetical protein